MIGQEEIHGNESENAVEFPSLICRLWKTKVSDALIE